MTLGVIVKKELVKQKNRRKKQEESTALTENQKDGKGRSTTITKIVRVGQKTF